jgi:hypothetical protein
MMIETQSFARCLGIVDAVANTVCEVMMARPAPIFSQPISEIIRSEMLRHDVSPDTALMTLTSFLEDVVPARDEITHVDATPLPGQPQANVSEEEKNQFMIELLTGVSLALYFIGTPIGRPWAHVRNWAEHHSGGLPNGVCISKAIGDLIREERTATGSRTLMIRSFLPVLLFRHLVRSLDRAPTTGSAYPRLCPRVQDLGRCYELHQFILYAHAKPPPEESLPFYYQIPDEILLEELLRDLPEPATADEAKHHVERGWSEMCAWVDSLFPLGGSARQMIHIARVAQTPACFLNHCTGLFTFEPEAVTASGNMPLPATYMQKIRRQLYEERLKMDWDHARTVKENLLDKTHRQTILAALIDDIQHHVPCPPRLQAGPRKLRPG